MPFPQPFVKVVASGSLFDGDEIWSTSWSMADPDLSNDAEQPSSGIVDNIALAVETWFTSVKAGISTRARLLSVKVNLVGTDGLYVDDSGSVERLYVDREVVGNNGSATLPGQCVLAITLRSKRARGPGAFGRFYPPLNANSVAPDGRISPQLAQAYADGAADLLDGLNNAAGGVLKVVNASTVGAGTFQRVERTACGRVVDTIQKRRNSLDEDYQFATVLNPIGPG